MQYLILGIIFSFVSLSISAQKKSFSNKLNQKMVEKMFSDKLLKELGITFPIYQVYHYLDVSGEHYIFLTEHPAGEEYEKVDSIEAFSFTKRDGFYIRNWSIRDFILSDGNEVSEEHAINFWTKYFSLGDYDKDGVMDPILIYGSRGTNGVLDGRVKILVYYNGKKRAIRHQNGTLDFQRNTQVDENFYKLPMEIQKEVQKRMLLITDASHAIFPADWQESMKNKEVYFDEN